MHYNIAIVGGGFAGRSLACALQHSSLKIALIDASPTQQVDTRLIALNVGSFVFLHKIGIWQHLQAQAEPIHAVHISHKGRFGAVRLRSEDCKLPFMGNVIRAQAIDNALEQCLSSQITQYRPATLQSISLTDDQAQLIVDQHGETTSLTADLVLAADGTHSTVRKLLHFDMEILDYQQSALVTVTQLQRSHQHIAYERFLDNGAIAMLPLAENQCATIWSGPQQLIDTLMAMSAPQFLQQLQFQFGYRLGRLIACQQRQSYPLHSVRVSKPYKQNVILLGNAAHTIHPLAAQGLNVTLYEITQLTQLIQNNIAEKKPLLHNLLENYQREQQQVNLWFSHYLTKIFAADKIAINALRQLSLVVLELCPPFKQQLSRTLTMEKARWI